MNVPDWIIREGNYNAGLLNREVITFGLYSRVGIIVE